MCFFLYTCTYKTKHVNLHITLVFNIQHFWLKKRTTIKHLTCTLAWIQSTTSTFALLLAATRTQMHHKVILEKKMSDIPVSVVLLVDGWWLEVQCLICQAQREKKAPEMVKLSILYMKKLLWVSFWHLTDNRTPRGLLGSLMKPVSNSPLSPGLFGFAHSAYTQQNKRKLIISSWLCPSGTKREKKCVC